jgi:hypothetical protein
MYITQGSNMGTHRGTGANDVRGAYAGVRYPYYAPCDCKLIWFDKSNGQGMWQSIEKVRFANGNIDYATFVTAHDETFDADKTMGSVIHQGEQLGNMGKKAGNGGKVTGVHCHIEIAQHKYDFSNWKKNKYGIYCFPNETDTDGCYFVDNTNIIYGAGGNWKVTTDVPVEESGEDTADQYLHVGSKVRFDGVFKADIVKAPVSSNLFGCTQLTGVSFTNYQKENCKPYHWIPANDFDVCDTNGNKLANQTVVGGQSYLKNDNIYNVEQIDTASDSAKLIINGRVVWIFASCLYEVSNN